MRRWVVTATVSLQVVSDNAAADPVALASAAIGSLDDFRPAILSIRADDAFTEGDFIVHERGGKSEFGRLMRAQSGALRVVFADGTARPYDPRKARHPEEGK